MYSKYMKLYKDDLNCIHLREEVCGVILESSRLNLTTKATIVNFFQFYNQRCRLMPLIVKNEKEYLSMVKELIMNDEPIKGAITKINDEYISIDISKNIDDESLRVSKDYRVLKDIRLIFENV